MSHNGKNLLKLVGTIAILLVFVILVSPYIDVMEGRLLIGLIFADIACIIVFRLFVEFWF